MNQPQIDSEQSHRDQEWMAQAIRLASRGQGLVEPNPMVGCVLVRDENLIGEGWHEQFGGPHAEVNAIRDCDDPVGATAYVTLEPCSHFGKTPPCSAALIAARVRRVVVATEDPFPEVAGSGIAQLREAGIEVSVGVCQKDARDILGPYLTRVCQNRPWVIAKWAMTIDGRIATRTGESQWITNPASRADVHRLRCRVDAIAVGMGTVVADDPMLTARLPAGEAKTPRVAKRVVYCLNRLPSPDSRLLTSIDQAPVHIIAGTNFDSARLAGIRAAGATLVSLPTDQPSELVRKSMSHYYEQGVTNLMLEGGGQLIASFAEAGLIDECQVYIGGKIFGGTEAPGPVGGSGIAEMSAARQFKCVSTEQFDEDVKIVYRRGQ